MLDLRNLIHMLQAHSPHGALDSITHRRATRARLALLAFVVVHRTGYVSCAADFVFCGQHACCAHEEGGGGRGAEREVEGTVRADGYTGGNRGASDVVGCSGVEFLESGMLAFAQRVH